MTVVIWVKLRPGVAPKVNAELSTKERMMTLVYAWPALVLMPYVLIRNREVIAERLARLSAYLGLTNPSFDSFLSWILALRQELEIPNDLSALGIDTAKADLVGKMAVVDPSSGGNPIALTNEEYSRLFEKAVTGNLDA